MLLYYSIHRNIRQCRRCVEIKKQSWILSAVVYLLFTVSIGLTLTFRQQNNPICVSVITQRIAAPAMHQEESRHIIDGKIDINHASAEELTMLPGIGAKIAENIVTYRYIHGTFENIAQLKEVKGIGDARFQSIMNYVTIGE